MLLAYLPPYRWIERALDLIFELLSSDESLPLRTSLDIADIKAGLEFCFQSTVFSYKNSLFMQTFGTPMGSCISLLIADIYMEHIEHTAITTFYTAPSLWLRFVCDTFCILNKEHITEFHSHLNTICSHIQFTMEEEQNLSYLLLTFWWPITLARMVIPLTAH